MTSYGSTLCFKIWERDLLMNRWHGSSGVRRALNRRASWHASALFLKMLHLALAGRFLLLN